MRITAKRSLAVLASSAPPASRTALSLITSRVGNGTSIFTPDGDTAADFAAASRPAWSASTCPSPFHGFHSFGGWKRSLFATTHLRPEGVRFYTRLKTITARWAHRIRAGVDTNAHAGLMCWADLIYRERSVG